MNWCEGGTTRDHPIYRTPAFDHRIRTQNNSFAIEKSFNRSKKTYKRWCCTTGSCCVIIWRNEVWKKTVELMFTVQTICNIYIINKKKTKRKCLPARLVDDAGCGDDYNINILIFREKIMYLTSSSLITGESRSLLSSPSMSTSSSCFSHPNTLTSSLSVGEPPPPPPPESVIGVGTFDGDKDFCTVVVIVDDDDDDICRSGDLDSLVDDDLIERSSVAADDDKSVLPG